MSWSEVDTSKDQHRLLAQRLRADRNAGTQLQRAELLSRLREQPDQSLPAFVREYILGSLSALALLDSTRGQDTEVGRLV